MDSATVHENVVEYYGKDIKTTADLKTSACLTEEGTASAKRLQRNVHPDVLKTFYGCGSPLPDRLTGLTVLDVGCGTGRDVYVAAQLVGPAGRAIGLDMTAEQLEVAERTEEWHRERFGFPVANTMFAHGDIENMRRAGIKDASIDVAISNCVVNLAADKEAVFREIWRVLKPGGELYFSDIYCDRRVPEAAQRDKVLWGECLSGALYKGDFRRMMAAVGFKTFWTVSSRVVTVDDPALRAALGRTTFFSETIRAIKVAPPAGSGAASAGDGYEEGSEDYGQTATYKGTIPDYPHAWSLGLGSVFITGVRTPVDSNAAAALAASRYAADFTISSKQEHRGAWRPAGMFGDFGSSAGYLTSVQPQSGSGSGASDDSGASCCGPAKGSCAPRASACC